jgi:uncharacterized membrane protein
MKASDAEQVSSRRSVEGVSSLQNDSTTTELPLLGGIRIRKSMTILSDPNTLYGFWRVLENLPRFMKNVESVREEEGGRSHWVVRAPAGRTVAWDAVIIEERPAELLSWRSEAGADIENAGSVRFRPAPEGRGTEVTVRLSYNPPAGKAGAAIAKIFGKEPEQQVREDLRRFKELIETGEIPTNEMRPTGAEKISNETPVGTLS